jgi:hypothetical protein
MPPINEHKSLGLVKMLNIGDSGSGKTGALISLVKVGYELRILDYDNKLRILHNLIKKECPDKAANVRFVTLTDKMRGMGSKIIPTGVPTAFSDGLQLLTNWKIRNKDKEVIEDLGPSSKWGDDIIIVIDTLTFMGLASLRYTLMVNGRSGERPWPADYGDAMDALESVLMLLYSEETKCHVIVNSHINFVSPEGGEIVKGFPTALGSKLPPKVGGYFDSIVLTKTKGSGASAKHVIRTKSEGMVELKNPKFDTMPAEFPIETGLAQFFEHMLKD